MKLAAASLAFFGCAALLQGATAGRPSARPTKTWKSGGKSFQMKGMMGKWIYPEKANPVYGYYMLNHVDPDSGVVDWNTAARMNFNAAKAACADLDADAYPTTIENEDEHRLLIEMIPNNRHGFWVGAVMKADGSGFKNIDGLPWGQRTYKPWASSEPSADGEEHCVFSGFNRGDPSKYNDAKCAGEPKHGKRVICKKPLIAPESTSTTAPVATTTVPLPDCAFPGFVQAAGRKVGHRKKILQKVAVTSAADCYLKCTAEGPRCTHFAMTNGANNCALYQGIPTTKRSKHATAYLESKCVIVPSTVVVTIATDVVNSTTIPVNNVAGFVVGGSLELAALAQAAISRRSRSNEPTQRRTITNITKDATGPGGELEVDSPVKIEEGTAVTFVPEEVQNCVESTAPRADCTALGQDLYSLITQASLNGEQCTGSSTLCEAGDGTVPPNLDCVEETRKPKECTADGQDLYSLITPASGTGTPCTGEASKKICGCGNWCGNWVPPETHPLFGGKWDVSTDEGMWQLRCNWMSMCAMCDQCNEDYWTGLLDKSEGNILDKSEGIILDTSEGNIRMEKTF